MAEIEREFLPRVSRGYPPARRPGPSWILAAPLLVFILIPVLALLLRLTPEDMLASLRDGQVVQAIRLSLVTSAITIGVTLLIGTPAAYMLRRSRNGAAQVLDTIIDMPTVLPPAVAGVALLMALGGRGCWAAC